MALPSSKLITLRFVPLFANRYVRIAAPTGCATNFGRENVRKVGDEGVGVDQRELVELHLARLDGAADRR